MEQNAAPMVQQKPVDITMDETKQMIINVINESRLPLSIVEYLLKDVSAMVTTEVAKAKQQYYVEAARQAQIAEEQARMAEEAMKAATAPVSPEVNQEGTQQIINEEAAVQTEQAAQ